RSASSAPPSRRAHRDRALGSAFVAVELAGEQRFEANLVVFHFEQFELEALAFRKAALGRHQQEAGIGLGRDDPCFQGFSACAGAAPAAAVSIAPAATSRARRDVFISWPRCSLSARQRAFIEIPVKDHAAAPLPMIAPHDSEQPLTPRLYPNYRAEEERFYRKTGIFPIMHLMTMRRTVFEQ